VTVPVGVLKAGSIAFEPGLPASHLGAIKRLGFGRFEKIAIRFEDAAWLPDGLPNSNVLASPADPEIPIIVSLDCFVDEPLVVAFGFGSTARLIADGTEADAVARLLDLIARITGVQPPEPVAATRTSWAHDPYTLGAYSYVAIGGTPDDFDTLGQPVAGRLLFAGEATSQLRTGYADGAMTSGIREAKRLLGVPEVQLGRPAAAVRRD
jgi:monoamine oxidase